jgi:hypothetical protein
VSTTSDAGMRRTSPRPEGDGGAGSSAALLLLNDLFKLDVVVAPCVRTRGVVTAAKMAVK